MNEQARAVAQKLVDEGKRESVHSFTVDGNTNDVIVVIVRRTTQEGERSLKRFTEIIAGPVGNICLCCSGTGRN